MRKQAWIPYVLLLPAVGGLLLFKLYPMLSAVRNSLFELNFAGGGERFTGLANYVALWNDQLFWSSLKTTLVFNAILTPVMLIASFALALLLDGAVGRGKRFFQTIQFIPVAISIPTACVLWGIMLSPEHGVVNSLLASFGFPAQPFLVSSSQALLSIIGIVIWKNAGYWALFILAGLQEVPVSLYEAARVDGAGTLQRLRHVTLPLLKRPFAFVAVAVTSNHLFMFSPMYILTQGGPQNSTRTLMLESFQNAFLYSSPGRASAIVVVLIGCALLLILAQFRLLRTNH
ncbi:carbohydrate ABC transporter permease [Paenibacillus sp. WLX1005]|uniref:carbohydrate ABC transporter permease n=1 Tax=Paenibacillus sp. WLX1005 TaxID=3243766 RepID=UPI0039843D00